jgi:tetratricopeptide (TPR) repeat protein
MESYEKALQLATQPVDQLNLLVKNNIGQIHADLGFGFYKKNDSTKALASARAFNQLKFVPRLSGTLSLIHLRPDKFTDRSELRKETELRDHVLLADMLYEVKDYDDAIVEYRKAIALNPDDGDLHTYLLTVYLDSQKWSEAVGEDLAFSQNLIKKVPEGIGNIIHKGL